MSQLSSEEKEKGVVAFSSGNHAIGIAISASELGVPAIIVMPKDAPQIKVNTVLSYGAEIRFYDRLTESREDIAADISKETGRVIGGAMVGTNAGEMLGEIGLALEMGADAEDVALTIHAHPTLNESIGLASEIFEGSITDLPNPKAKKKK